MDQIERETMDFDVVIVGAGPAGLSAAIRLKQIDPDLNVVVLEKGSEVGAHILSGAVLDPGALTRLMPDWKERGAPIRTEVTSDSFLVLGEAGSVRIPAWPMPRLMSNHGNYIVSLGNVCRWMAEQAEALGVEVFPGMAASALVMDGDRVAGVVAGEMGLSHDGTPGPGYEPGMELRGKYVFIAEGVRGSLAKQLIQDYDLSAGHEPQKFGIGMKEIWEIDPARHKEGTVVHTMGWPLGRNAGGGSFIYHAENNQVYLGFVVHLNYENPYLNPYLEFQRFKHHPAIAELLEGGKRVAYGARAISEGGWQSIPKLTVPGAVLLGCSAGLVNVPRIKGSHNAMKTGMMAADAAYDAVVAGREGDRLVTYTHYGTGNYHPITARIYTDLSLFTCDPALGRDATKVFNYLSGYVQPDGLENLSISPFALKDKLVELIGREAELARQGRRAAIWAKMNSLTEREVIEALYAASQAGVKINLVIRGICGLRPGIEGLSANIRVKSIVGRFLEHSRIVCFGNGHGLPSRKARVFISSADWMDRNLNRRVETLVECLNDTVKAQITNQVMAANMADEAQSWILQPDGRYLRHLPAGRDDLFNCHRFFMENPSLSGRGTAGARDVPALTHSLD